jgi:hypothetical protein
MTENGWVSRSIRLGNVRFTSRRFRAGPVNGKSQREEAIIRGGGATVRSCFFGPVQESVRDPDFNGVWPCRCQAARRRRGCGNVGTRV